MNNSTQSVFNFLTVDLEDWFHILDLHANNLTAQNWDNLPSNLEQNTDRILGLLSEHKVLATFFILGFIADKYPALIRKIDSFGHEIACHGQNHDLIYDLTPQQFSDDIQRAKMGLEEMIGKPVKGYRGPGFSITRNNLWAFDVIAGAGFSYDATVYPGTHGHGGIDFLPSVPFTLITFDGHRIDEFPASVLRLGRYRVAFSGGGYFRLLPFFAMTRLVASYNSGGTPVMTYLHPRDLDPQTPRLSMPLKRRFKCYVNVSRSYEKLRRMLAHHSFGSVRDWQINRNEPLPVIVLKELISRQAQSEYIH